MTFLKILKCDLVVIDWYIDKSVFGSKNKNIQKEERFSRHPKFFYVV